MFDAYEQLVINFDMACSKVRSLLKDKETLEDLNESLKDEVCGEKHHAEELAIKRKELQTIMENFDTTTMQEINDELLQAQLKMQHLRS